MKSSSQLFYLLVFIFWASQVAAQDHDKSFESIDVLQYVFNINLNDSTNCIDATADIIFQNKKPIENLTLDLTYMNSDGLGMKVESVKTGDAPVNFTHENNQLIIDFKADEPAVHKCSIKYSGIPADGLIISQNKYGDRTFFGDNWPDRARNWLPTVDHPSDKARVVFEITAPDHYKIVSNGKLDTVTNPKNGYRTTIWKENVPISTKVMVIGAADFEVGNDTVYNGIPVNAWVFKENREKGLENYRFGAKALEFYSELIGPYPYEKLAHVQSKTQYGGMENAGCIFYNENSATSDRSQENLFAHEVAHQWFGNSATEQNWHHIWLSEGFATYLTSVYNQHFYGEQVFRQGLYNDRQRVIRFSQRYMAPVIDSLVTDYSKLINTNSYQKASWFLHMLRHKLGDDAFFNGLRSYYSIYRDSTALTADFRHCMEKTSGQDLKAFFDQWLRQAGHPVLKWSWNQDTDTTVNMKITQKQEQAFFSFPLDVEVFYKDGNHETFRATIDQKISSIILPARDKVKKIELDPGVNLLYEEAN